MLRSNPGMLVRSALSQFNFNVKRGCIRILQSTGWVGSLPIWWECL